MAKRHVNLSSKEVPSLRSNKPSLSKTGDHLDGAKSVVTQASKYSVSQLEEARSWFDAYQASVDADFRSPHKVPTLDAIRHEPPAPFEYQPLDHSQPSIRLIHLLPKLSLEGLIQCRISHGSTSSSYVCLSYVWDPPPPYEDNLSTRKHIKERVILVNRTPVRIHENLFNFLWVARYNATRTDWHLERLELSKPFWIDALCINQRNNSERNHQVGQMGEIYTCAESVHAWLGLAPLLQSDKTFARPQPSNLCYLRTTLFEKHMQWWLWRYNNRNPLNISIGNWKYESDLDRYIFENTYWKRAWIVQEVRLARDITFWLHTCPVRSFFIQFLRRWFTECRRLAINDRHYMDHDIDIELPGRHALFDSHQLIDLLEQFRDKQCANPRDRVYSLLSLSATKIQVDYKMSRQRLAYSVLARHPKDLCLCTANIVARALLLNTRRSNNFDKSSSNGIGEPWIELKVSACDLGTSTRAETSTDVSFVCSHAQHRLNIKDWSPGSLRPTRRSNPGRNDTLYIPLWRTPSIVDCVESICARATSGWPRLPEGHIRLVWRSYGGLDTQGAT